MTGDRNYKAPSVFEKAINSMMGWMAAIGLGPAYLYRLEVKGRKSGKLYFMAVCLLETDGKQFLVAPRGRTQWARNAEAAGEVTLKRGSSRKFRLRVLSETEKPPVLRAYLATYKGAVQRFFPVKADDPLESFAQIASGYPAYELTPQ